MSRSGWLSTILGLRATARASCLIACTACATGTLGATDAELVRGTDGAPQGATIFASECASCHGRRGQGVGDAPALLGSGGLSEYPRSRTTTGIAEVEDPEDMEVAQRTHRTGAGTRAPFRDALDVYTFMTTHGRGKRFKTAPAREAHDWAIVAFLFAAEGAELPPGGLTPENARDVTIPKR